MKAGGRLVSSFEWLVGSGSGAGMALIVIFSGLATTLVGLGGFAVRTVRDVEQIQPDHDAGGGEPDTQAA